MEPRRFYLDTANRSFVASPDTTVPAPTNLFFREDVEAVELYFLKPTGNLAQPYEYRDYSANTVKLAIGLTTPAALQTSWTAVSTTITYDEDYLQEGGNGLNEVQRISFSGRKPASGGFSLTLPARTVVSDLSSLEELSNSTINLGFNHGLFNGQAIVMQYVELSTGPIENTTWYVVERTSQSFRLSRLPFGAPVTNIVSIGGDIITNSFTTAQIPFNATAATVQQAFVDAGLAESGVPQISVFGSFEAGFTFYFANALAGVNVGMLTVSSTLAAAPCLSANVSFNTTEVNSLITAGTTSNLRFEVEVSGSGRRQTYATACDISADIIASASTSPVPIGTANSFSLSDGSGGVWTVTVDANGILTTNKI
jgi:hypothetical protein